MTKPRINIETGKEYGWLTILDKAEKDMRGHIRWNVRCRCGKEYTVQNGFLLKPDCKCRECYDKYDRKKRRLSAVGDILNGWKILEETLTKQGGAIIYRCKCLRCGNESYKTRGEITADKGNGCQNCPPDYHFSIYGDIAVGILPDGTSITINADQIEKVEKYHWHKNDKGYIIRGDCNLPKMYLHWYVLGYEKTPGILIDHINRDKTDCRRDNLRLVTRQQNAMNRSIGRNSTSGYVGVSYVTSRRIYRAQIHLNNKSIYLGSSSDPVVCAQIYNVASEILFGLYAGHRNDVPDPSETIRNRIIEKCRPYMEASALAQLPCSISASA